MWRHRGRIIAFCGLRLLNQQDAWLYGMRVADDVKSRGFCTRFTRALIEETRSTGRKRVGINTYHYPHDRSPVYRIAERVGMKLNATHAVDVFWDMPKSITGPDPRPTDS